jgi:hypothetical protein
MFEVGKRYRFITLEHHEGSLAETTEYWSVKAVEGHLLHLYIPADTDSTFAKLSGPIEERSMVLNTMSAFFHGATPVKSK